MTRDLAVIIVTWNVRDLVAQALETLLYDLANSQLDASVHVFDSASSDGTAESIANRFPEVDLVASEENLGFARGNNLMLRRLGFGGDVPADQLPRAVYLLNPDTATQPGATRALFEALFADPQRGFVGARLSYGDGSFQHGAFAFPGLRQLWTEFFPTPGRFIEGAFNGRYSRASYDAGQPFAVDCVLGAAMMLRREAILETGLFDEQFFMYCEEVDWAWRIHDAGYDAVCVPAARVTHFVGQSTQQARPRSILNLWTSRFLLYRKHYPRWKQILTRLMVAIGMYWKARKTDDPEVRQAYINVREMALRGG